MLAKPTRESPNRSDELELMTYARSEIVNPAEVGVYHCVSRCVRRAYLCGRDNVSRKSFEHRRNWIRGRLSELSSIFAVEVIAYAIMSNHLHSVIQIRPDRAESWTDEEVAMRWRRLFPLRKGEGQAEDPSKEEIAAITSDPHLVAIYRDRLSSLSWFHRCLNEHIARRANAEEDCTGRFWEGRFKCQRIFEISGILACSAYVDLNPVRAGMAKTLEDSDHTSAQDRIQDLTSKVSARCRGWARVPLLPIPEITEGQLTVEEYLEFVEETGQAIREGKGSIPAEITPILQRLRINPERWVETAQSIGRSFRRMIGPADRIEEAAAISKKCWFQGLEVARQVFG